VTTRDVATSAGGIGDRPPDRETDGAHPTPYMLNRRGYGTHQAIAERVRPDSKILDVGCASGYVMAYLREAKGCDAVGIEQDSDAAHQARLADFSVIEEDAERGMVTAASYGPFDHVIFGDVLEHMVDPGPVLAASHGLLRPGGSVIVSLPNIVSLRARVQLAMGVWRYADAGIFDRTHLRFFTVATGRALVTGCGFSISHESFVGPLTFFGGRRFLALTALRPGLLGNQMVFEALPAI
jgi:methionine biosynthesis protein MetW